MLATSSVPYSVPTSLPWVPEACGVIFSHQACGLGASPFLVPFLGQVNSLRQLRPVPFGAVRAGGFDSELKLNQTSRPVRKQGGRVGKQRTFKSCQSNGGQGFKILHCVCSYFSVGFSFVCIMQRRKKFLHRDLIFLQLWLALPAFLIRCLPVCVWNFRALQHVNNTHLIK